MNEYCLRRSLNTLIPCSRHNFLVLVCRWSEYRTTRHGTTSTLRWILLGFEFSVVKSSPYTVPGSCLQVWRYLESHYILTYFNTIFITFEFYDLGMDLKLTVYRLNLWVVQLIPGYQDRIARSPTYPTNLTENDKLRKYKSFYQVIKLWNICRYATFNSDRRISTDRNTYRMMESFDSYSK